MTVSFTSFELAVVPTPSRQITRRSIAVVYYYIALSQFQDLLCGFLIVVFLIFTIAAGSFTFRKTSRHDLLKIPKILNNIINFIQFFLLVDLHPRFSFSMVILVHLNLNGIIGILTKILPQTCNRLIWCLFIDWFRLLINRIIILIILWLYLLLLILWFMLRYFNFEIIKVVNLKFICCIWGCCCNV